jgi:catechol 2,3-dioxygenase-like lactoylglutathione lyase family enzyme
MQLALATVLVREYDEAIAFFVDTLGFTLVEDTPVSDADDPTKRWVVVRPSSGLAGLLLARASTDEQRALVGRQGGGRVAFFLHVDDFATALGRLSAAGVEIVSAPRDEPYGQVVVFRDLLGNAWDLLGPPAR